MATGGVPSGTILAVPTEMFAFIKRNRSDAKCLTFMIYFLTFMGKAHSGSKHMCPLFAYENHIIII
jgi:hypothetical protein